MNKLLYFAFLSCFAITGCDKPPNNEGDKEKARSEHESREGALHPETRLDRPLQSESDRVDQRVEVTDIAPREDRGTVTNVDYRNAKPEKSQLKKLKKLTAEEIKKINASMSGNPVISPIPEVIVETVAEAFERVNVSLSMATVPEVFAEDDENYYFSGGLSVERVDDFSSGVRISKNGGAIHVWPSQP